MMLVTKREGHIPTDVTNKENGHIPTHVSNKERGSHIYRCY